jgi:thioredoxin 1
MKAFILPLLSLAILTITSCSSNGTGKLSTIDPKDFLEKLNATPEAQLIDVRTPEEFQEGSIENAINIDWNGSDFVNQLASLDKNAPVFIYCLSGGRSAEAGQALLDNGFQEVYELDGGFMAWNIEGLPVANAVEKSSGLTREEYTKMITSDGYVLVDFSAEWCGPCKKLAPIVSEIEQEYKGKVKIVRIDVDENPEISQALNVNSIPLLHLYKKGNLVWENVGLTEKSVITEQLK